jgi:opacity protein-like surface antigen
MRGCLLASVSALAALAVASAHAGDLPRTAPATSEPVASGTWTGFHLGTHVGAALVDTHWGAGSGPMAGPDTSAFAVTGSASGTVIGGQIGYDRQIGSQVYGIEAELSSGILASQARCLLDGMWICVTDTGPLATLSARAGYASGNALFYGRAGVALAANGHTVSGTYAPGRFSASHVQAGWALGGGVEVALSPRMSARLEYTRLDFGNADVTLRNGSAATTVPISQSAQMVRLGLNWHPWGAPLPSIDSAAPSRGHDWSGFHVGAHAGGAWGRDAWSKGTGLFATAAANGSFPGAGDSSGLLGGLQIGFDHQMGPWLAGLEVSADVSGLTSLGKCVADNTGRQASWACSNTVTSLGAISGRFGQSLGDLLVYGRAGAAWATGASRMIATEATSGYTSDATRWGVVFGGGLEYALTRDLSAFVEYDRYDFGSRVGTYTGPAGTATARLAESFDTLRMGLNYHFSGEARNPASTAEASAVPAGWSAEIGSRYFFSGGRMHHDLMDPFEVQHLNSRLIYADSTASALETFFRFENRDGLFVKGFAGLGHLRGGTLRDEDFPGMTTYSNTLSKLGRGDIGHGALDLGYDVIRRGRSSLGAFVGYRVVSRDENAYGCRQTGPDEICGANHVASSPALARGHAISQPETWRGVALGLDARLQLTERLRLGIDAAYLPYAKYTSADNHWWRADINPMDQFGTGWGAQIEAMLDYAVTDRLSVGIGARYWHFTTDSASTHFYGIPERSPQVFYSERYGAFAQASYRFGDVGPAPAATSAEADAAPYDWTGVRVGGSFGAAKGRAIWASPFGRPVSGDAADLGGALADLRIGADRQIGDWVFGAEASLGWANVVGSNTCFSSLDLGENTAFGCSSRVGALGTLTGRIGRAFDRSLLYVRGGLALEHRTDRLNDYAFTDDTAERDHTDLGWTIGAGIEHALTPDLSVGLEYRHFDFGRSSRMTTDSLAELAGVNLAPDRLKLDTVGLTLRYRLTGGKGTP